VPLAGHGLRPTILRRRASRPQLKRDPLGGNTFLSTRSAKGRKPNKPRFNEFSSDSMR